jgi:hypothetical protein
MTDPKPRPSKDPYVERIKQQKAEEEKQKKADAAKKKAVTKKQAITGPRPQPNANVVPTPPSTKPKTGYKTDKPNSSTIANQKTDAAIAVGKAVVAANRYQQNPNKQTLSAYNKAKASAESKVKNILRYSDGTLVDIFVDTPQGKFFTPDQLNFVTDQGWDKDYKKQTALKPGEYAQDYVTGEHVVTHADGSKTTTLPSGETYEYDPSGKATKATDTSGKPSSSKAAPPLPKDAVLKPTGGIGPSTFSRNLTTNGLEFYYTPNDKTTPIALIGDANGNAIRTGYNTQEGVVSESPLTVNDAFNTIIQQLQSTPDGVRKFKQLAIAKHLISPSYASRTMLPELADVVDEPTSKAILSLINAVTNHNVTLAEMNKPNQKFMGYNDYLNNMTALSVSNTNTTRIKQKVDPKDYELTIDDMFQRTIGRGATAEELKHFAQQLQIYANANPKVTTETKTETTSGSSTSATVSGGITEAAAGAIMRDEALKQPEAEEFNKGSKFFNWFQEAINSPIQLGG